MLARHLTIALHLSELDKPLANELIPILAVMAGRLLINGFGTGFEFSRAMVCAGPFQQHPTETQHW